MIYSARWVFTSMLYLYLTHTVTSISMRSEPEHMNIEELLQNIEFSNEHESPQVSRRGYAGDDFYQKASKSIPRMGRRSERDSRACLCTPEDTDEIRHIETFEDSIDGKLLPFKPEESMRRKRLHLEPKEVFGFPPHYRVLNSETKRAEVNDPCYYLPKDRSSSLITETCDENMICCPNLNDASIVKRVIPSRTSKPTTTSAPDYKSNQFM